MVKLIRLSMLLVMLTLAVSSCKTKEKVTETRTEQVVVKQSTSMDVVSKENLQSFNAHDEQSTVQDERDSIVEKFREYIVMDSTGNVLRHEIENMKKTHKSKGKVQTNNQGKQQSAASKQEKKTYEQYIDSLYNASVQDVKEESKPVTFRWLWLIGILLLLVVVGTVISKIVK